VVIGVGIDIIEIERIRKVFEERGEKYVKKIYTAQELEYSFRFKNPYTHLAARFSAKEAYYKAVGFGVVRFGEIETLNLASGKPVMRLYGQTHEQWESLGSPEIHLSLSHNNLMGCATVVLEKKEGMDGMSLADFLRKAEEKFGEKK
jgi:holo-[acyl-carrier protein] synthase